MTAKSWIAVLIPLLLVTACGIGDTYFLEGEDLERFENAGPIEPEMDTEQLLAGIPTPGPYRVVPGDLLEIRGAGGFLGAGSETSGKEAVLQVRVRDDSTISLPLVGDVGVLEEDEPVGGLRGLTLVGVERAVVQALYPTFLRNRPSIVVKLLEPQTVKVAVMGAVENPGVVELSSDRLSLYGALSEAGGILKASNLKVGARVIRIRRASGGPAESFALPVRGLNLPFADAPLVGGETIEVERWEPELFTVVGLVEKPGAYEYPPGGWYNLMQALAIAGGIDRIANPPYATVFRQTASGQIVAATFPITGHAAVDAVERSIKPGDVISVDHTIGSWSRSLIASVFRAQVNFFVDPLDAR